MATTFEAIATVTVGSGGAANIEFTSIPQTYTDLIVKTSLRGANDTPDATIRPNGSTSSQSVRFLVGNGSTVSSFSDSLLYQLQNRSSTTASVFSNGEWYIPNYTSTSINKSFSLDDVTENNATGTFSYLLAGLWSSTSAITSLTLVPASGNFAQYSSATLYGIKNS